MVAVLFLVACEPPPPPVTERPLPAEPAVTRLSPMEAIQAGDLEALQAWEDEGIDWNAKVPLGSSPVHEAVAAGRLASLAWFHEQGHPLDIEDADGLTPVAMAALRDDHRLMDWLREQGEPVAELELLDPLPLIEEDEEEAPEPAPLLVLDDPEPEDELPEEWKDLEFRTWTSASGRQVEAAFLSVAHDTVSLGGRNGQTLRIPITHLIRDDQIYARQMAAAQWPVPSARPGQDRAASRPPQVTTGFSQECERMLVRAIQQAREEVLVAIYTITRSSIEEALSAAARRGVVVKVKYDAKQTPTSNMQELIDRMEQRGVILMPITMSGRFASMHHKFLVVDRTQVFTGSFNFTTMASTQNYENCVLIDSVAVARDFVNEFERIRGD